MALVNASEPSVIQSERKRIHAEEKGEEDGSLIDGMEIAKKLYDEDLTPGQLCLQLLESGKKTFPDFYRSDLQDEFDRIWNFQKQFNPQSFCDTAKEEVKGKNKSQTWAIPATFISTLLVYH